MSNSTLSNEILFSYSTVGCLIDFKDGKIPVVETFNGHRRDEWLARTCVKLQLKHLNTDVVLLMTAGDSHPIITGVLESQPVDLKANVSAQDLSANLLCVDGHTINLHAAERISLKCGETQITLTKDGKITLKGKYVLSRAKVANRIQGGSVELN